MAERFTQLNSKHIEFIHNQHIYFVGTAGAKDSVNVSSARYKWARNRSGRRAGRGIDTALADQRRSPTATPKAAAVRQDYLRSNGP